jgi:ribonuclease HI
MKVYYADGSCLNNPGVGAWGFTDLTNSTVGNEIYTTNGRMELMAVVECVNQITENSTIYSDSIYVVNGFNEYIYKWKNNAWKKKGGPIKHLDLWMIADNKLTELKIKNISVDVCWVKGHADNYGNNFIDRLVQEESLRVKNGKSFYIRK